MFLSVLSAQTIDFDLKEYKQPEMKRHSLETSFDLSGMHLFSDAEGELNGSDYFTDQNRHYFRTTSDNSYSYFKHSENLERGFYSNLFLNYNLSNSDSEGTNYYYGDDRIDKDESYGNSLRTSIEISGYNRFYPANSFFFIETNLELLPYLYIGKSDRIDNYLLTDESVDTDVLPFDYRDYNSKITYNSDYERFSLNYEVDMHPELIFGVGKIKNVSDARLAIYILQDLQDTKCLIKQPSKEEIIKLAELISTLKNERFFDNREKKIDDITKIDEFLRNNALIKDQNAAYFTSIYDNWDYANQPRYNGSKFSIGFTHRFHFTKNTSETDNLNITNSVREYYYYTSDILDSTYVNTANREYMSNEDRICKNNSIGLEGILKYEQSTPYNLYLQGDLIAELNYGITSEEQETERDVLSHTDNLYLQYNGFTTDSTYSQTELDTTYTTKRNLETDYLRLNLSYSLRYYLDTRTDFGFTLSSIYSLRNGIIEEEDEEDVEYKEEEFRISTNLSANYYISPKLRLHGSIGTYYSFDFGEIEDHNEPLEEYYINRDQFNFSYGLSMDYFIF